MASHPTPRASSTLMISYGLLNVGVKLAPMVDPKGGRLSGRFLDPKTLTPAKQVYVNEATGEVVEKVTGYPSGDGFVVLDEENKHDLKSTRDGRLEIQAFVEPDAVDPLYFEKTNLVWPDKGHEQAYDVLCGVLAESGRYLVGTAVVRDSTKVVVLRYAQGCLLAHVCTYDANLRWNEHRLVTMAHGERPEPNVEMVKLAEQLFSSLPEEFDFASVTDEYDARLRAAVEAVAAGRPIEKAPEVEDTPVVDLMEALKASVAAAKTASNGKEEKKAPAKRSRSKVA